MTLRGYFPHKLPDLIPSNFGFAFVLGKLGLNTDPTFNANWEKVKYIRRGIYQRPIVNSTDDAFKHSSNLIELCQYNNPAWNDMPLLLNILVPNLDLTFISVWVSQIINELHPKEKPLLFTTPKHWNVNLQGGPNSEVVSKTILQQADIISSEYNVELPSKLLYVDKLKYWEYSNGLMQFAPDGVFESVIPPVVIDRPPADSDPSTPPAIDPLAKDLTIHIKCPHCKNLIF
jgi:hypothetical protein